MYEHLYLYIESNNLWNFKQNKAKDNQKKKKNEQQQRKNNLMCGVIDE